MFIRCLLASYICSLLVSDSHAHHLAVTYHLPTKFPTPVPHNTTLGWHEMHIKKSFWSPSMVYLHDGMINLVIFNAKKNLSFSNSYTGKFIKSKFEEKNEKSFFLDPFQSFAPCQLKNLLCKLRKFIVKIDRWLAETIL